jgi:hypothetical protein
MLRRSKMPVTEEYKRTVRLCPVTTKPGPASDPRDVVEVDWSYVLTQPGQPGYQFLLGWDPRLTPKADWVDESLQYAPAPAWAADKTYIIELEKENLVLKAELAKATGLKADLKKR